MTMSEYDNEYFFIEKPKESPQFPSLVPDTNTEDLNFRFEAMPFGSPPLVFYNGWREKRRKDRIKEVPADVLFEGSNLVVHTKIREELLGLEIPHLSMHPAVFIDKDDKWHEDYWYMCFTQQFDCWDRDNSTFEDEPVEMGGMKLFSVYTYSLNKKLLDETPLPERLLFKMGGTQDGYVVCHQSIVRIFRRDGTSGATLTPVADY